MGATDFTDSTNLRNIAKKLRRSGHTAVPDTEELKRIAEGLGIADWLAEQSARNEGDLYSKIAFHMAHTNDTSNTLAKGDA